MKKYLTKTCRLFLRSIFLMAFALELSACEKQVENWVSLDGKQPRSLLPAPASKSATINEFISGSHSTDQSPPHGYKVSGSIGSIYSQSVQTSQQGYKIYSSVRGTLTSENQTQ